MKLKVKMIVREEDGNEYLYEYTFKSKEQMEKSIAEAIRLCEEAGCEYELINAEH